MNIKGKLAIAGALVALTLLLALYALLPTGAWSLTVTCSAIAVALLAGTLIYLPSPLAPSAKTNAGRLALLGPMGLTIAVAFLLACAALVVALFSRDAFAWTLLIFSIGSFVVGCVLASSAATIVDRTVQASAPRYQHDWMHQLQSLAGSFDDKTVSNRCAKLAEDMRYAPSPVNGVAVPEAAAITVEISMLQAAATSADVDKANLTLSKLERLLTLHWQAMIAARSHA